MPKFLVTMNWSRFNIVRLNKRNTKRRPARAGIVTHKPQPVGVKREILYSK